MNFNVNATLDVVVDSRPSALDLTSLPAAPPPRNIADGAVTEPTSIENLGCAAMRDSKHVW